MAANRETIHITDPVATTAGPNGDGTYQFALAPTGEGGRGYTLETREWQPGDPTVPWRIPLHPWDGGLGPNKMLAPDSIQIGESALGGYGADTSFPPLAVPGPEAKSASQINSSASTKQVLFGNDIFLIGGRYCHKVTSGHVVTSDKDFGVGLSAVDAVVFNNELVVAMGATEKIWTRNSAGTWTQATDNTFAIALGVSGDRLWRGHDTNQISSCSTAPRTLASWTPADPNEYVVGDTSFAIDQIIDYGGVPWAIKRDGAYQPDPTAKYRNQAPQMQVSPSPDTKARWAFTAWGYLFVPWAGGLLRLGRGSSVQAGPETSAHDTIAYRVRSGAEFRGSVFLLCDLDRAGGDNVGFIVKMIRRDGGYAYYPLHDHASLDFATGSHIMAHSFNGSGTTVDVSFVDPGESQPARYWYFIFPLSGGRDIDNTAYQFRTVSTFLSGWFTPADGADSSVVHVFQGVDAAYRGSASTDQLQMTLFKNMVYSSSDNLLTTQEGGGSQTANGTGALTTVRRYAPANTTGNIFNVKFRLACDDTVAAGLARPELWGAWAFGFSRPSQLDVISVGIVADENVRVGGRRMGMSRAEIVRVFKSWKASTTVLTLRIPDYEVGRTTRFLVTDVRETEAYATVGAGVNASASSMVMVEITRLDYADAYADA